jgi:hypothetical protein
MAMATWRAMLIGLRNNFRRDEEIEIALDLCSYGGAKVMGLDKYGLTVGCAADLVLVPAETLAEASYRPQWGFDGARLRFVGCRQERSPRSSAREECFRLVALSSLKIPVPFQEFPVLFKYFPC